MSSHNGVALAVRRFLDAHGEELAAPVRQEVRSKLETGRENPRRARNRPGDLTITSEMSLMHEVTA